jgi:hypothetical protein
MAEQTPRNAPCPCGSGRKYKVCCYAKDTADRKDFQRRRLHTLADELIPLLVTYAQDTFRKRDLRKAHKDFAKGFSEEGLGEDDPDFRLLFLPWIASVWSPPELSKPRDPYPRPTVALSYLFKHQESLASDRKDFLLALTLALPSFYQVREVVPGRSLILKDLFFGLDAEVSEKNASQALHPGDILFTRVVHCDAGSILVGSGGVPFPPQLLEMILSLRDEVLRQMRAAQISRSLYPVIAEPFLRQAYFSLRERLEHPEPPILHNTDGEPLDFCVLTYDLKIPLEEAFPLLAPLCFSEKPEDLLSDAERDKDGRVLKLDFPWLKKGNAKHKAWDNTVVGHIVLTPGKLQVHVNSQERAERAQGEIQRRLGDQAAFLGLTLESPTAPRDPEESDQGRGAISAEEIENSPELKKMAEEFARKHWASWFDEKIPMLKDQTPRQAAKTDEGRALLEALLFDYERQDKDHPNNLLRPDIPYLKRELGLK